jgi:hypothetical protein
MTAKALPDFPAAPFLFYFLAALFGEEFYDKFR